MERLSKQAAEQTRQAWRDFGLFYASNTSSRSWHLHGSRAGLLGFADLLDAFAAKYAGHDDSEHEHLGPHMYLTLTAWPTARLDQRGIWGTSPDFRRLAGHLRGILATAQPGDVPVVRESCTPSAEYALCLHVKADRFDPASLDPQLAG